MKQLAIIVLMFVSYSTINAQFVAKMEVKEPIEGLCDKNEVYALFPIQGQEEAVSPLTKQQILEKLNNEIQFLKDNPEFDGNGMIGLIINCRGDVVQCKMDNKTKSPELDKQMEAVFSSLGSWKAGKLNSKEVDSSRLFAFKIKNGKISFDR